MIPIRLTISGFLSYRDPVELDFIGLDLACISGANGAGKSSLLDAITWVLFGQARKRDDSVINAQSGSAEVGLIFFYEGNIYRVQRTKQRDVTTVLEFQILQGGDPLAILEGRMPILDQRLGIAAPTTWKTLTERTFSYTEARIREILRLDYDTFVNASFFLQGKADQFTQQRPADRKRILSNILGLEAWETYRKQAADLRKKVEIEITTLEGRLHEIDAELREEDQRKSRLKQLEADLARLGKERAAQEAALSSIRQVITSLLGQQTLVNTLGKQLDLARRRLHEMQERLESRQQEQHTYADIFGRAAQVEVVYQRWQADRLELERLETVADQFREQEKRRSQPLEMIATERARLYQELQTLQSQQEQVAAAQIEILSLHSQLATAQEAYQRLEAQLALREKYETELQNTRQQQVDLKAVNQRLKVEMTEIKQRIDRLSQWEEAVCPFCGKPLSDADRTRLIEELVGQGKERGDLYRANEATLVKLDAQVQELIRLTLGLTQVEGQLRLRNQSIAQLASRLDVIEGSIRQWDATGQPRVLEIERALEGGIFALEARQGLAAIDAELKAIGYDAERHDAARRMELEGRSAEVDMRTLERARAASAPLAREIADLEGQIERQLAEFDHQQAEFNQSAAALADAQAQAPDLEAAESALDYVLEQENRLRIEVGGARQKVDVLEDQKKRRQSLEAQREAFSHLASHYQQLERAFGKDGVPALLIEQALPEIEVRANEFLDRLSGGTMSVRFVTQAAYKDRKREDLKETLDIQISDGAGTRDYEMFSGGEAFRINFAIRLALSQVLAQRAGARLQTLVIDEGFGSQDTQGRQRLIEAVNQVRSDFAKILVITHIDELKDVFPNRIEVEKTERGSVVRVI